MYTEWEVYDTYNEETMVAYVTEDENWIKAQKEPEMYRIADISEDEWPESGCEEEWNEDEIPGSE